MAQGLHAPALGLNTIIFKYVYWYMKQISGERLQDHWSSGITDRSKAILLWWFLLFYVLVLKLFVLFAPYVSFHIFN